MEWTEEKLAKRIQRAWHAAEDHGESLLDTTQLAQLAASAILDPETWAAGDTIPAEVDLVENGGGFVWSRIRVDGRDTGHWEVVRTPHLREVDLLVEFGPVREANPDDVPLQVRTEQWPTLGENCPACGVVALVAGPDRVTVRCPQCGKLFMDRAQRPESRADAGDQRQTPHYDPLTICPNCHDVVDATIYCGEEHPEHGWVCDKPADHETGGEVGDQWHFQESVGKTWMVIPESRVTIPTSGKESLTEQLARALEFLNYLITQGSAPGTATITKKIVNRAQGRARDLERALMWAADREAL
jgi:hypothetical protein